MGYVVYILQSERDHRFYYGFTNRDADSRLKEHNEGKSSYTNKYRPWKILWFAEFSSRAKAQDFERYLKTPSGHAFSRKRLI